MRKLVIGSILALGASLAVRATDYYVSPSGSDSNDGLTEDTPLATITKANANAGKVTTNRILIAPGEYVTGTANGEMFQGPEVIGCGDKPTDVVIKHSGGYRPVKVSGSTLRNLTVCGGATTSQGGCVYMDGGLIDNCVLTNGVVNAKGGNLWMSAGVVTNSLLIAGTCTSNNDQYGGGNAWMEGGTMVDCDLIGGAATAGRGGNMTCYGSAVTAVTVSHCRFADGEAATDGGNLCLTRAATVSDCTFTGGVSTSSNWDRGGGNVASLGNCLVSRCVMRGGSAQGNKGGGIRARAAGSVYEDCLIEGNPAGGVYIEAGAQMYNCTIVKNLGNGVWVLKSTGGKLVNCVVYGNLESEDGNSKDWAGDTLAADNVVTCALGSSKWDGQIVLQDASAFAGFANGDYAPAAGGVLEDAGTSDPRGADASSLDVNGNARICKVIDIGAYERQKTAFTFGFGLKNPVSGLAPQSVTFVNQVADATGSVTFTYDFGDGTTATYADAPSVDHEYAQPGDYTVTVTATDASGESSTVTYESMIRLLARDLYVVAGNADAAFPYNTFSNAAATISAAVSAAQPGCTVTISNGVYNMVGQIVLDKAVTVKGLTGNPEDVVVHNTGTINGDSEYRLFDLSAAGALVTGLVMENGQARNKLGAGLRMSAGCVSNCVIRNCNMNSSYYGAGAGARVTGSGLLTHSVITNNVLYGSSSQWYRAAGVSIQGGGAVENCLIAFNRSTGSGEPSSIVAGVLMESAGDRLVNCTIVSNIVEYPVTSSWAGLRPSYHGVVKNCVIAENYNLNQVVITDNGDGTSTTNTLEGAQLASVAGYGDSYVYNSVTDVSSASDAFTVASSAEMFVNLSAGDFTPALSGPLYDTGLALDNPPSVDLAGLRRVFGRKIDVGCFESQRSKGLLVTVR